MRRVRRQTGKHAPLRSWHRRCQSSCRRNRRTASRQPHGPAASSETTGLPRPDKVRRTSSGRNCRDARRDIPPAQLQRHALAAQLAVDRQPVRQRSPVLGRGRGDRIEAPLQCGVVKIVRHRPADAGFARPRRHAPAAVGRFRDWRQSGAWTGRRPTAAGRHGFCAWVISVGPSPLLSKKERSPADSRITQRRSSRPSTALLPSSPTTGTGGRHPPETVALQPETLVAMDRREQPTALQDRAGRREIGKFSIAPLVIEEARQRWHAAARAGSTR